MKKTFFSFFILCLSFLGCVFSVQASTCQVTAGNDDINSGSPSLRFYLESYIYNPDTGQQNSGADCSDNSDPLDGAEQLISFKDSVTSVTLDSKDGRVYEPLRLNTLKNFVIGDSDQTVVIHARNLAFGTSPFDCIDGSKLVYPRNLLIETNGITDIFADEHCLVETDSVHVCNGTIVNTDVSVVGWCNGETWPVVEDEEPDTDVPNFVLNFNVSFSMSSYIYYWCKDEDRDTYYTTRPFVIGLAGDYTKCTDAMRSKRGDCNDSSNVTYPGAIEIADGLDNDCDDLIDEDLDADGDGYYDAALGGDDCNDNNAAIHPGATEVCDSIDNNCNGFVDEGLDCRTLTDSDGDGFYAEEDDCVDNNAEINPDAIDVCGDGIDQNCSGSDCSAEICSDGLDNDENGLADCSDPSCTTFTSCNNLGPETVCYDGLDDDGDGVIDCLDADCAQIGVCTGTPETECGDGLDNDGDGIPDCDDTDCYGVVFDPQVSDGVCPISSGGEDPPTGDSGNSGCGCYLGTAGPVAGQVGYLSLLFGFGGLLVVVRVKRHS